MCAGACSSAVSGRGRAVRRLLATRGACSGGTCVASGVKVGVPALTSPGKAEARTLRKWVKLSKRALRRGVVKPWGEALWGAPRGEGASSELPGHLSRVTHVARATGWPAPCRFPWRCRPCSPLCRQCAPPRPGPACPRGGRGRRWLPLCRRSARRCVSCLCVAAAGVSAAGASLPVRLPAARRCRLHVGAARVSVSCVSVGRASLPPVCHCWLSLF